DYERETVVAASGAPAVGTEAPNEIISNFPKKGANVFTAKTVYQRLKAHVAPYEPSVVRDICGCAEADIAYVVSAFIANSRCSSPADAVPAAGLQNPTADGYKATTMLYAMGLTQHTYGSQNVKSFATLQTLMGNMGRAGGGINALRGIHNVQGSTDMGNLYHLIPFYSGNPTHMTAQSVSELATESDVLTPGVIDGAQYYGFAEAMTAADGNALGALVNVLANKDGLEPGSMAAALNPARWDVLAYRATNIASAATYTYLGKSDLIQKATAAMSDVPLPGDICFDGTVFRAYVPAATSGKLYELTSTDGFNWTATANVYNTTTAVQYPTVMSDGTT
ncbi:MAG: hypothetical protein EG825_18515, partial [Rhodocyclaceae bacterium]|nr:hypothetical protein [Rhodocyclaceae bacterium]